MSIGTYVAPVVVNLKKMTCLNDIVVVVACVKSLPASGPLQLNSPNVFEMHNSFLLHFDSMQSNWLAPVQLQVCVQSEFITE